MERRRTSVCCPLCLWIYFLRFVSMLLYRHFWLLYQSTKDFRASLSKGYPQCLSCIQDFPRDPYDPQSNYCLESCTPPNRCTWVSKVGERAGLGGTALRTHLSSTKPRSYIESHCSCSLQSCGTSHVHKVDFLLLKRVCASCKKTQWVPVKALEIWGFYIRFFEKPPHMFQSCQTLPTYSWFSPIDQWYIANFYLHAQTKLTYYIFVCCSLSLVSWTCW